MHNYTYDELDELRKENEELKKKHNCLTQAAKNLIKKIDRHKNFGIEIIKLRKTILTEELDKIRLAKETQKRTHTVTSLLTIKQLSSETSAFFKKTLTKKNKK